MIHCGVWVVNLSPISSQWVMVSGDWFVGIYHNFIPAVMRSRMHWASVRGPFCLNLNFRSYHSGFWGWLSFYVIFLEDIGTFHSWLGLNSRQIMLRSNRIKVVQNFILRREFISQFETSHLSSGSISNKCSTLSQSIELSGYCFLNSSINSFNF